MRTLFISIVVLMSCGASAQNFKNIDVLLESVRLHENRNDLAKADLYKGEYSYGPLQVRALTALDVAEYATSHPEDIHCQSWLVLTAKSGKDFSRPESYIGEDSISKLAFIIYAKRYATKGRLGRTPTWQDMARIWNRGPNGFEDPTSIKYWQKVSANLNSVIVTYGY